jgi:hypothetical protein
LVFWLWVSTVAGFSACNHWVSGLRWLGVVVSSRQCGQRSPVRLRETHCAAEQVDADQLESVVSLGQYSWEPAGYDTIPSPKGVAACRLPTNLRHRLRESERCVSVRAVRLSRGGGRLSGSCWWSWALNSCSAKTLYGVRARHSAKGEEMHARVSTLIGSPDQAEVGIQDFRDEVVPWVKEHGGRGGIC